MFFIFLFIGILLVHLIFVFLNIYLMAKLDKIKGYKISFNSSDLLVASFGLLFTIFVLLELFSSINLKDVSIFKRFYMWASK